MSYMILVRELDLFSARDTLYVHLGLSYSGLNADMFRVRRCFGLGIWPSGSVSQLLRPTLMVSLNLLHVHSCNQLNEA